MQDEAEEKEPGSKQLEGAEEGVEECASEGGRMKQAGGVEGGNAKIGRAREGKGRDASKEKRREEARSASRVAIEAFVPLCLCCGSVGRVEAVRQQRLDRACLVVAFVRQPQAARADVADGGAAQHAHNLGGRPAIVRHREHVRHMLSQLTQGACVLRCGGRVEWEWGLSLRSRPVHIPPLSCSHSAYICRICRKSKPLNPYDMRNPRLHMHTPCPHKHSPSYTCTSPLSYAPPPTYAHSQDRPLGGVATLSSVATPPNYQCFECASHVGE
eukprot:237674-Chlamydomonas_euryale.AAC.1